MGAKLTLAETTVKGTIAACIFSGVPDNTSMENETKLSSSQTHSLSQAEATARAMFPKGLKILFAPVSGLGPIAYTWHAMLGTPYSGLNVIKGSTGFFSEVGGALHLTNLEKLERLAIAA